MPMLAPVPEYVLVGAMLDKSITVDDLDPKTLSHTGSKLWRAAKSLNEYDEKGVLVAAVEVFGLDKNRLEEYLAGVRKYATKNAADIHNLLKNRSALISVANEIQQQLSTGNLDLDKITGFVSQAHNAKVDLTSVSEDLEAGAPDAPHGPDLISLPKISAAVHGLHGFWIIAGLPGIGKSTLARQIVIDGSRSLPALIYDFENPRRDILYQLVEIFGLETARAIGKRLYIRESLRTLSKDLARIPPPAIILVDSIQRVPVKSDDYLQGLNGWINRFEELKQRGYTVIFVSEINRASYSGEPRLDCFKESGRLEYATTFGVFLQDGGSEGLIKPHIIKNRSYKTKGPIGLVERTHSFWFKEIATGLDDIVVG